MHLEKGLLFIIDVFLTFVTLAVLMLPEGSLSLRHFGSLYVRSGNVIIPECNWQKKLIIIVIDTSVVH